MKKKKLRLKQKIKDGLGIAAFYLIIVLGVVLIDARIEEISEQQKSATETATHIAHNQ